MVKKILKKFAVQKVPWVLQSALPWPIAKIVTTNTHKKKQPKSSSNDAS